VTSKNQTAFNMGGGGGARKKAKPRLYRKITRRDVERQVARQTGTLDQLKPIRNTPSDVERLAKAAGYGKGITTGLSARELQQLEADLSSIGILAGRIQGTLPERLIAKYLLGRGLPYEGMGYSARLNQGWAFQLPTRGGRAGSGDGAVIDIAVAGRATFGGKALAIRANGLYWHTRPGAPAHDAAQKKALERQGWAVLDLWDYEAQSPGVLDAKLRPVLK
jgi:hypothetical protein